MTPTKLKSKEFEELILDAGLRHRKKAELTIGRYGVQVALIKGQWTPLSSLPDFDGILAGGRQIVIEAKVCSGASFALREEFLKPRQVRHMLERSAFGAASFLLIHWNERQGKTFHDPAETVALPVTANWDGWQRFLDGEQVTAITREAASQMGRRVHWTAPGRATKPLPDILGMIHPAA